METTITKSNVYSFAELSEDAKETAIVANRLMEVDDTFWSESVIEDAKTIGALAGIEIENVWFSHSYSQGDGACFEGSYSYKIGALKAVKDHAPMDEELHDIVKTLQDIQRRNFYGLQATCTQSGHYNHSGCMQVDLYEYLDYGSWSGEDEQELTDALRLYADWIFSSIVKDYEYFTSDEYIRERLEERDDKFLESGQLYTD